MSRRYYPRSRVVGAASLLTLTIALAADPAGAATSMGPSTGKGVPVPVTYTDVEWNQSGALQN